MNNRCSISQNQNQGYYFNYCLKQMQTLGVALVFAVSYIYNLNEKSRQVVHMNKYFGKKLLFSKKLSRTHDHSCTCYTWTTHFVQESSRCCRLEGFLEQPGDNNLCSDPVPETGIVGSSPTISLVPWVMSLGRAIKNFLRASLIQSYRQNLNASSTESYKFAINIGH